VWNEQGIWFAPCFPSITSKGTNSVLIISAKNHPKKIFQKKSQRLIAVVLSGINTTG